LVVSSALLASSAVALADPVTDADFRGKTICWNNGSKATYGKDGSFDSNRSGHGTWSLSGDVLTVSASNRGGASAITKENGRFHALSSGRHGKSFEGWGTYCN
jgi:hypothetical protein